MEEDIRQDIIIGSRRFSNYFWTIVLFIGGLGFYYPVFQVIFKLIYYHLQIQHP